MFSIRFGIGGTADVAFATARSYIIASWSNLIGIESLFRSSPRLLPRRYFEILECNRLAVLAGKVIM